VADLLNDEEKLFLANVRNSLLRHQIAVGSFKSADSGAQRRGGPSPSVARGEPNVTRNL
jgi:hypothetical protein